MTLTAGLPSSLGALGLYRPCLVGNLEQFEREGVPPGEAPAELAEKVQPREWRSASGG